PRLASGELLGSVAFASAAGSYDPTQLTCTWAAGGGSLTLSGESAFVLDADVASVVVVAATDASGCVVAVAVDTATPGLTLQHTGMYLVGCFALSLRTCRSAGRAG